METIERKSHWEKIYKSTPFKEMSWYQPCPVTALEFAMKCRLPQTASIIDIGGGDSLLADHMLQMGYSDITVLDISAGAIERAKTRLGSLADRVQWVVSDVVDFQPDKKYDYWHDRAAFHFLTSEEEIAQYVRCAESSVKPGGHLLIGTFSLQGPQTCSNLPVQRYSKETLSAQFKPGFERVASITVNHKTPSDTTQDFVFCGLKRDLQV